MSLSTFTFTIIVVAIAAAIVSGWGNAFLRRYAERQRVLMDVPNERSSHTRPKPRGGGVMIVLLTLLGVIALMFVEPTQLRALLIFLLCGGIIAITGWIDDMRSLSTTLRLAVQILCALLTVLGLGYFDLIRLSGDLTLNIGLLGLPLTIIWIVGLTNAYNFMDGIDGIAGGQAVVGGVMWLWVGWLWNAPILLVIGVLIAASSLGFLWHNWQPSRIIMGDVGATFLGYAFAVLPLLYRVAYPADPSTSWGWTMSIVTLWAFLADTGITMLRRALRRENIFQAHRSHFYQQLVIRGWSHAAVSLLYIGCAALGMLLSVWVWHATKP
ncbi:MAG: glycosyltransferase family 4 protein [Anaerolineae bacterium]|nr:glycosyltransferase family 4 protein [Anaerolineae bacterium]